MSEITTFREALFVYRTLYYGTPPKIRVKWIYELSDYDDQQLLINLVRNPDTPMKILKKLARSKYELVREAVARCPKSTPKLLKVLLKDPKLTKIIEANPNYMDIWIGE